MIFSLVVIALLSACRNEFDFEEHYPGGEIKKEYADNWVKQMGPIDPNQDWCMAGEYSVTVTVPGEEDVKVYALKEDEDYQLVAEYFGISGTQTLVFDAFKGTKNIIVSNGVQVFFTEVGESVSFGESTRAGHYGESDDVKIEKGDYKEYEKSEVDDIVKSGGILPKGKNNRTKVTSNFVYVAKTGKITIYPKYWDCGNTNTIGIYFYDKSGNRVEKDIYTIKSGDEVQYFALLGLTWKNCTGEKSFPGLFSMRSRAIEVTVPIGTIFGLYLDNGKGNKFYSEEKLNEDSEYNPMAATFLHSSERYFGFEDQYKDSKGKMSDFDLCDVLFTIQGDIVALDATDQPWIIACEDLGDTGDYDFNDLVFEIKRESNGTLQGIRITPLAAGGTLSASYGWGTETIGEIHQKFGNRKTSGKFKMINTNADNGDDKIPAIDSKYISYNKSFSLVSELNNFWIKVGSNSADIVDAPTYENIELRIPGKGEAPQMIIVPNTWIWPAERQSIIDAYPGFKDWSSDSDKTGWVNSPYRDESGTPFLYNPNK